MQIQLLIQRLTELNIQYMNARRKIFFVCVYVCVGRGLNVVPKKSKRGHWVFWDWSYKLILAM